MTFPFTATGSRDENRIGKHRTADVKTETKPMNDAVLTRIVQRLVEAYEPLRVYLFGSKARGDGGADSDYDLMVVVSDDAPAERRRSRLAYEALWGTGAAADVLVWTRETFDSRLHLRASLPATIRREGKLLYAARSSTRSRRQGMAGQSGRGPAGR